jgi:cell division septal protein FtsQ
VLNCAYAGIISFDAVFGMGLFNFRKKKKKEGHTSNISFSRSPYLKKMPSPEGRGQRQRRGAPMISPARIKPPSNKGKKILALLLAAGILGYSVYAIFFSDYFLINKYKVEEEGTIIESNESINSVLETKIGQNLVLLNEDSLLAEIKSAHPEINKIAVKKNFPGTLVVEFEKFPTAANIVNIVNGVQRKFLVDSQGLLTEENADNPNLPYIKIETRDPMQVMTTFLPDAKRSTERLDYIIKAINLYEEKFGMKIMYAVYKIRERELHLYTEKYFFVILDMEKDLSGQLDKLKKTLSKLDIYTVPLLYIDLRISGSDYEKVIFKRKTS